MDERRRHPRAEIDEVAFISVGGSSTSCRVRNISIDGAAIEVPLSGNKIGIAFE
jgi:hypothetical protein